MSLQKTNPHHLEVNQTSSLISFSFVSQNKTKTSLQQIVSQTSRKLRLISILISAIYRKRLANAFHNIKYKPMRAYVLKKRLVEVFLSMVRRSEYERKYQGFKAIQKTFINKRNQQVKRLDTVLFKTKISVMKLLVIFMKTKMRQNIETSFQKISAYAKQKQNAKRDRFRKGFRLWIKIHNNFIRGYFMKLRSSRFLIQRRRKIQSIVKVLREYRIRSLKGGIDKLRRNLFRQRERAIRQQILLLESQQQEKQDDQLRNLKQKQEQLLRSLGEIKKEMQEISEAYKTEVKQAQAKNQEIQQRTKALRQENQKLIEQIKQINQQLNQEYTIEQIFQMFYNNMLCYISRNKNNTLTKSQLLQSLAKPLVPIEIPLPQLKQQNKVLKELIDQYILIYGQKDLEGRDIQIPYEYLVKENQNMYLMLTTLLNRCQYNTKKVSELKESFDALESVFKKIK